jgi:hypothetical protein
MLILMRNERKYCTRLLGVIALSMLVHIKSEVTNASNELDEHCILVKRLNLDHMVDGEDESFQCHLILITDSDNDFLYFSLRRKASLSMKINVILGHSLVPFRREQL